MTQKENWWMDDPWRMIQTNLREIDMEDMDAKEFASDLADYHATVVTLNAAGILADYETKLPYQKTCEYLHGSGLEEIIEECHKKGIKVIARCDFTKIPEETYEKYPHWAYRDKDGNPLIYNGFVQTCINGEYQQKKVLEILDEVFTNFAFDGLFCNMSGVVVTDYELNIHEPCHCENCKTMFKNQFGMELPDSFQKRDATFGAYMRFINTCSADQKKKIYETVKSIRPSIAVNGFDYFRTECNQDINHHPWVYDGAANSRRIAGRYRKKRVDDASAVYMAFQYRHTGISSELLKIRQWQNLMYGGGLSVYTLGTLKNKKDPSALLASKEVYEFYAACEEAYNHQHSAAKVLLLTKALMGREDEEQDGLVEILSQCHIPFDEMRLPDFREECLGDYEVLLMGDVSSLSESQAKAIDDFVAAGGKLIATGGCGILDQRRMPLPKPMLSCLGMESVEKIEKVKSSILELSVEDQKMFSNCAQKQIGTIVPWKTYIKGSLKNEAKGYFTLLPEQPFGPPEICYEKGKTAYPGVIEMPFGKGKSFWAPFEVGSFYREFGYENTFFFMKDVLESLAGIKPLIISSPMVEATITESEDAWMIHLLNLSGSFGNTYHDPIEIGNVVINFDAENREVICLNGGEVNIKDGALYLKSLKEYEAVVIKK
ncbi:MAG: beta-galactosidase [Lachnospiraceae bacterium]|nr:beta-galactosidase [Lachnospiraceae bacterium]